MSPDDFRVRGLLGLVLLAKGQPQAALQEFQQEPDAPWRLAGKTASEFDLGDQKASDRSLEEFIQRFGDLLPYNVAQLHAHRGEIDEAFEYLEIAYDVRAPGLGFLKTNRPLTNLHDDPRWPAFLEKMGLPTD